MEKYKINLVTLSPVILSSRMQGALYNEIDYTNKKDSKFDYEIIYPFYSYDNRYDKSESPYEKAKNYYIPASSLKGALQLKKTVNQLKESEKEDNEKLGKYFIFKDIQVKKEQIKLENLQKYQYLYQEKNGTKEPKLDSFFPKVGVEMIKNESELEGNFIVKDLKIDWKKTCQNLNDITFIRLNNNIKKINELENIYEEKTKEAIEQKLERNYKEKLKDLLAVRTNLEKVKQQIEILKEENISKAYIFLGGFKGLLNSVSQSIEDIKSNNEDETSLPTSFFIDQSTKLLYGLTIIEIKNN